MSELSNALGGSAPKHNLICKGVKYPVSLITQAVKVAYERALYEKARTALADIKPIVDKDYYERRMDALVERYESGGFAMESEFGQKALTKPGGSILLLSILLGIPAKSATTGEPIIIPMPELDVVNIVSQAPEETALVFKTVVAESFPGVDVNEIALNLGQEPLPKVQSPNGSPSG